MGAELLLGVVLLLGTVWLATHLAVRIFTPKESPPREDRLSETNLGLIPLGKDAHREMRGEPDGS